MLHLPRGNLMTAARNRTQRITALLVALPAVVITVTLWPSSQASATTTIKVETESINRAGRASPITYDYDIKQPGKAELLTANDSDGQCAGCPPAAPSSYAGDLFSPYVGLAALRVSIDPLVLSQSAQSDFPSNGALSSSDETAFDQVYDRRAYDVSTGQTFNPDPNAAPGSSSYEDYVQAYEKLGDVVPALLATEQVDPGLLVYVNLKCNSSGSPWPSWMQGSSFEMRYAQSLKNFLIYLNSKNIHVDQLGILCEEGPTDFYNDSLDPTLDGTPHGYALAYANIVTDLKNKLGAGNPITPGSFFGPDSYYPQVYFGTTPLNFAQSVSALPSPQNGTLTSAATHFYNTYVNTAVANNGTAPKETGEQQLLEFANGSGGRRLWDTEFHWDNNKSDPTKTYYAGRDALYSLFANFDDGVTGMAWWDFEGCTGLLCTDPKGQMETQFIRGSAGASELTVTATEGTSGAIPSGTLTTRAYRAFSGGSPVAGSSTQAWVVNDTGSSVTPVLQPTDAAGATNPATSTTSCYRWTSSGGVLDSGYLLAQTCTVNADGTITLPDMAPGSIVAVQFATAQ